MTFEQGMAVFCALVCICAAWQIAMVRLDHRRSTKPVETHFQKEVKKLHLPEGDPHHPLK